MLTKDESVLKKALKQREAAEAAIETGWELNFVGNVRWLLVANMVTEMSALIKTTLFVVWR